MSRFLILVVAAVCGSFLPSPAVASGDYGCTPLWSVVQYENGGCNNSAILGPGNDTRVNLLLLMQDFYPDGKGAQSTGVEPLFEWRSLRDNLYYQKPKNDGIFREHTRCGSNSDGAVAFVKALKAAKNLTASERDALIDARKIFEPECGGGMREIPFRIVLDGIKTDTAKEFRDYLRAAIAFYDGDFDAAKIAFGALSKAKNHWVRETAQYMLARNALNQAQENAFDEWGYFDGTRKRDTVALDKARDGFQSYLKNWPKGQYAYSARSLMRRVYWLGNDPAKLAAEYRWHLGAISFGESEDLGRANHANLAEEIDSKLLPRDNGGTFGGDPLFLAVDDLMRMRERGGYFSKQITRAEIEAQKPVFARHPELYQYLMAAHAFYVDKKPAEVIAMIPDSARFPRMGFIHFSRQALRGLALDAVKDRNARGFWEELVAHAGAVPQSAIAEMALALNMARGNAVADVFAPKSLVRDITVRELLMMHVAGPAILRAQAGDQTRHHHEREVALFTLLYKGLSRGRYGEFVADLNLTPKGARTEGYFNDLRTDTEIPVGLFKAGGKAGDFACPHIRESASVLSKNAKDIRARLCVADFFRLNGFDQMQLETPPDEGQLGSGKSLFPGQSYSRLELYKGLIADPKIGAEEKAYALYRAVYCYAPGGNNSCSGKEVPQSQRKAWHDQLKREYPKSTWAQKLQFYW